MYRLFIAYSLPMHRRKYCGLLAHIWWSRDILSVLQIGRDAGIAAEVAQTLIKSKLIFYVLKLKSNTLSDILLRRQSIDESSAVKKLLLLKTFMLFEFNCWTFPHKVIRNFRAKFTF